MPRRLSLVNRMAGAAALITVLPAAALAQAWPQQPVKLMVGFPAGGPSDLVARSVADQIGKRLSQTVVVENKPGAHAVLATEAAAAARPDGLTLLAVASRQRSALLPEVPTFEEAGVRDCVIDTRYGLMAPAGTPTEVVRALTREAADFGRAPATRERLATAGLEPSSVCGDAFAQQVGREIEANARIARELNLKVE